MLSACKLVLFKSRELLCLKKAFLQLFLLFIRMNWRNNNLVQKNTPLFIVTYQLFFISFMLFQSSRQTFFNHQFFLSLYEEKPSAKNRGEAGKHNNLRGGSHC